MSVLRAGAPFALLMARQWVLHAAGLLAPSQPPPVLCRAAVAGARPYTAWLRAAAALCKGLPASTPPNETAVNKMFIKADCK